ncbi:MAG: UDP-N-acetylmuramoyl-L-alanine--D-glutamate ligase [Gemmatimonadota bacterium]
MNDEGPVRGRRVAVLGLGRSGRAAARLALARGAASVYASDTGRTAALEQAREELEALGAEVELGRHDPARLAVADLAVISPGIALEATPLAELPGARVIGELELAYRYLATPVAAVTGTNGKTTTTALLQAMCERAGLRSRAAGNIGRALSEVVLAGEPLDVVVCEVSSFQLSWIDRFRPRVAVLTNFAPDHLDRYPDLAAYRADKEAVARNQTAEDALVLNADDPGSRGFAAGARASRHAFTTGAPREAGLGVARGMLVRRDAEGRERPVAPAEAVRLRGPHNLQNALAASLAALLLDVPPGPIEAALRAFPGVPNRLEEVGRVDGVTFVNDSKATNVDATVWALRSFDTPLHLILGGRHKGSPYAPLLAEMHGNVKQVLALGEARERIVAELGRDVPVTSVGSLEEAVHRAFRTAEGGDTVLLSPACSSYDMFRDFEERGEAFRRAVGSLRGSPSFARRPRAGRGRR